MSKFLRQSTASQEILIGRMVDSTDGNTEKTALTIANTDIKLWFTGATTLTSKNSGGATHIANGIYYAVLDATDTATLGPIKTYVHVAGALAWEDSYMVLPAVTYDTLVTNGIMSLFTQAQTESYAADGAAPSVTQALMLILQALTEFLISGTSFTIKKLDGSTTAAVLTLNSSTAPTSVTRSS